MPNWLGKCLCIVAALGVFDGHLMVAQTYAWVTMIQDRAPEQGFSEALDSTFSGEAPCPMCCAIQSERQEKQEEAPIPESKPTAKYPPCGGGGTVVVFPPSGTFLPCAPEVFLPCADYSERPPLPPPQRVF